MTRCLVAVCTPLVCLSMGCGGSSGVCETADVRNGTTVCGLNDEGVRVQECVDDEWVDGDLCTGTDVCTNDDTQDGTTACGLNGEGMLVRVCTDGEWVDGDECVDPDVCEDDDTQDGTTVCGLNDEGVLVQECFGGQWSDGEGCSGTDICVNGAGDAEACIWDDGGTDTDGLAYKECTSGEWPAEFGDCMHYELLGLGECRQGDGEYPLQFSRAYEDLNPHTLEGNADIARARCQAKCLEHPDWCFAVEVVLRDIWPAPECALITDRPTFEAAGNELEHNEWGGIQIIDGEDYQTLCHGAGDCEGTTNWAGGMLSLRDGYECYLPVGD